MRGTKQGFWERALDGCHKVGWLINLLIMLLMFAYFTGEIHTGLQATEERLSRIETVLDQMLVKQVRGTP